MDSTRDYESLSPDSTSGRRTKLKAKNKSIGCIMMIWIEHSIKLKYISCGKMG